jgi:hypothetical protein
MGFYPFGGPGDLQRQAVTPAAGFALVNGTPNIITWTAPNDGLQHRFLLFLSMDITVAYTGGQIIVNFMSPGGNNVTWAVYPPGAATGPGWNYGFVSINPSFVKAGTAVTLSQGSAMTAGAATLNAEIWGS